MPAPIPPAAPPVPPAPVQPPQAAFSPFQQFQGPQAPAMMPPTAPPTQGVGGSVQGAKVDPFTGMNPSAVNQYGGQQIAGARPEAADYGSVQNYADAAMQNANRYLDPEIKAQSLRFNQELVNKGIDPMSDMGRQMSDQMARQQADAKQGAAFGALGFGQGIQDQMARQGLGQQQLAGDMQKALWQTQLGAKGQQLDYTLGKAGIGANQGIAAMQDRTARQGLANQLYGMQNDYGLGMGQLGTQRYGMDQDYTLGMGSQDIMRQGQNFDQMLGLEGVDFRNRVFNEGNNRYQDTLAQALMYGDRPPGVSQADPNSPYQTSMQNREPSIMEGVGDVFGLVGNFVGGAAA